MKIKEFFINMAKGGAIGLAMIIPGVSGGTLAVLLGVYDKIIDSLGNLFSKFRASFMFLLPLFIGAVIAFAGLYFPLKYALEYAAFPTVTLFAGLMLGSVPDLIETARANGFNKKTDIASIILPLAFVVGICFIPHMGDVNLAPSMEVASYWLILLVGVVASCALVVPGVSGSMLLLIFGYYKPLLNTISEIIKTPGHSIIVLGVFVVGVIIGFFTIAKLMQYLLNKYRRITFWAIVGFVIGSIPAIIITFYNQYGTETLKIWQLCVGIALFILGAIGSYFLVAFAKKKGGKALTATL